MGVELLKTLERTISAIGNHKSDPLAPVVDVLIPTMFLSKEHLDYGGRDGLGTHGDQSVQLNCQAV